MSCRLCLFVLKFATRYIKKKTVVMYHYLFIKPYPNHLSYILVLLFIQVYSGGSALCIQVIFRVGSVNNYFMHDSAMYKTKDCIQGSNYFQKSAFCTQIIFRILFCVHRLYNYQTYKGSILYVYTGSFLYRAFQIKLTTQLGTNNLTTYVVFC